MLVEMKDIVKRYKEVVALDYFNLEVRDGEIYGLLGPNGCGKTTAINCMLSLISFDNGEVKLFGEKMSRNRNDLKEKIGLVMQDIGVYDELSVRENIDYFCGLYIKDKKTRKAYVQDAIEFVGMAKFENYKPKKLSGGLRRRLNLACGIAHKPELIILDEPTVAVDPQSRYHILENIKELAKNGKTVVYTTHYMEEVEEICDRLTIMDKGKTLVMGTVDEITDMSLKGEIAEAKIYDISEALLTEIGKTDGVDSCEYDAVSSTLRVGFSKGSSRLIELLRMLNENNVSFIDLTVKKPSLNDVFLEITGKELRDSV